MNKGILLITYFFLCSLLVAGQTTFIKTLGGLGEDMANSAIKTNDGNYLVLGSTTSFGSGERDAYVAKLNSSAKEIWDKAVGGSGNDEFIDGIQIASGDFILVGNTTSVGAGERDILVTRMDNFGGIVWSSTFGDIDADQGYSIIETSDGNIIIVAQSYATAANSYGLLNLLIIKLMPDGSELWTKTIDPNLFSFTVNPGIVEDEQGNYLVSSGYLIEGNGSQMGGALFRLDNLGNLLETKIYNNPEPSSFNKHIISYQNGFQNFGEIFTPSFLPQDIWMTDYDLSGNVNWSKSFSITDKRLTLTDIDTKSNGNYLMAGEISSIPVGMEHGFLMEVDINGNVIWAKTFEGDRSDLLNSVFETSNGVIAFGRSKGSNFSDSFNVFVVRTNEFGTVSGCSEDIIVNVTDLTPTTSSVIPDEGVLNGGQSQNLDISIIGFEESVECDGCDSNDLTAGLFCETAPIICSIDCLDGFTGTLPNDLIMPQPDPLCDGGIPNNMSWFAFVAGSNTVDLSIIPTNCTTIFDDTGTSPQTIGIQAGVYEGCDFENSFICMTDGCLDLVAETVNISSDQFEIGQIYYLFVDGCGGSICDYEVVVNSAEQAFAMPELTTISNDLNINLEEDTLCLGTEIAFTLDDFDLDVNFNWSIDPPTADYPSGVHPVDDTSTVSFVFSEEGCFDIHVYGYNECDNSETVTFRVCVETLIDETFSDIFVCQECFPITLVSPESGCIITEGGGAPTVLIEDPNGDGVPGWLGTSTIVGPGLDSNLVTNIYGCTYTQYVNVVEIPLSPRAQFDYYFCLTEFPVVINGTTFNNPGDSRNITLEGQAASGCDSLISITAYGMDLFGISNIGNCDAGEVELAFVISNVVPETYDSITYIWYDANGDIVTDNNGVDSILLVMGVGSYSVQVGIFIDGVACSQTFGPYMIDVDNLAPNTPTVTYAPIEICVSELQAQIYVGNQGLGENYVWTLNPNLPFTFGLSTDTIYVDLINGQDFEFCVHAVNGCGFSNDICDDVIVNESPDSEFTFGTEICIDSFTTIEYSGPFGNASSSVFNWNFDGGVILNGMDPNSGGPFEIGFSAPGMYTLELTLIEEGCSSILTQHIVNVVEPFTPPMIDCESNSGFVTFSWDATGVDNVNINLLSGQSFEWVGNTYVVSGLSSEEEVIIEIEFNAGDICGGSLVTENCSSLPCPDVTLEVTLSDQGVCIGDVTEISLTIDITGDGSGQGMWNGSFISNDQFDAIEAGIGEHPISYNYVIGDCIYNIDTTISIFELPEIDIDIFPSFCEEMGSNLINVITSVDNNVMLDGFEVNEFIGVEVQPGDHILNVSNGDGCITELNFNIESSVLSDLLVLGENEIIEGETKTYAADYNSNLENLILIWTLNGDTICIDCSEVDISPELASELCVSINYGDGCSIEDCLFIEINQRTKLFIPNIFSPNNDNVNDIFTINSNSNDVFIVQIMIFDRWGEMVYNQKGFNVGEESSFWDGTVNGRMCESGVYVYLIEFLDEEDQRQRISGDLTLVK